VPRSSASGASSLKRPWCLSRDSQSASARWRLRRIQNSNPVLETATSYGLTNSEEGIHAPCARVRRGPATTLGGPGRSGPSSQT
jgi:hypothetical protein